MHRHREIFGKFDRANFQDLRADARQLDHLVVGNPRQLSRLRTNSRISRKYTFDIGVNFARRGVEKSRQRHRAGVRAAASESGDIVIFVDALKAGDDDDIALVQRLHDLGRIDAQDARLAVSVVGLDTHLMAQVRARRLTELLERERQQGDGNLLAGGEQHVFLTLVGDLGNLMSKGQ